MYCLYSQNVWNCNPTAHRNSLIRSLIDDFDADFCTFQECAPWSIRAGVAPLQELLKDKYTEIDGKETNFTPVFFKTEKFRLVDSGYHLYSGLNDANSKSVTWAVLEDRTNGKKLAVMSTHFWWMFDGEADNLQRIENARELKTLCETVSAGYSVPVIIGGDFNNGENAPQGDEPYRKMLEMGFTDVRFSAKESTSGFTQRDCLLPGGIQDTSGLPNRTIDYIFSIGNLSAQRFDIPCSEKALASSDHLPLILHFDI